MALKPGQRKCIATLDKPIVVAAGAGSGKTFTLTKRIVGALASKRIDDIGQVCAITFTNKAAAELKSRIKAELRAVGLVEQSLKADDAWISTIHGMCARILRSHALELDLDPKFKMADEGKLRRLRNEAIDEVLSYAERLANGVSAEGADGAPADITAEGVAALFEEYTARSSASYGARSTVEGMLESLIDLAGANLNGADAFKLPAGDVNPSRIVQSAADLYGDIVDAAELLKPGKTRDTWLATAHDAFDAVELALSEGTVGDCRHALELLAGFTTNKQFGPADFKERVEACIAMRDACIMELRLAAAAPLLRTLVALARKALATFQEKKRREGILDNSDLLVLASRALEEHPEIAAVYADMFQLVMVDEFQDTDQMQVDMIKRIAGPGACRLCTVGDAQQSIYRFRGADVSVYRRHLKTVRDADPDGIILLPDNFRSHPDVLSLVDRVFARPDMFGGEFMSLAPGRDESQVKRPLADDEPRVQVQQVTKAYTKGVESKVVVAEQARQVAEAFAAYHAAGHPAGDMAVLLGRMANAGVYAQALRDVGLACVVSGGSVFRDTPEAGMVLELARVAVNAADTQALLQVLAGPMFRVSDDDLLALSTARSKHDGLPKRRGLDAGLRALSRALARAEREGETGEADGRREDADQMDDAFAQSCSEQLRCAVRVLGALQASAGRTAMSRALMRAVVDSGWISRLEAEGPEGLAAAANVYKAIRMVEDIEADEVAGPVSVMNALGVMLELAKEAPGALSTEGGDFVRIMTVHSSKGLEFPIVAVSEFREGAGASSNLLSLDAGDTILLSLDLGNSKSAIGGAVSNLKCAETVYPAFIEGCDDEDALKHSALHADGAVAMRAALSEYHARGDAEEAKRLLYVALTRAKEALVVSFAGKRKKKNPQGVPENCLAQLVAALSGGDSGFEPGGTTCDFGGLQPAFVRHTALEADAGSAEPGGVEVASEAASEPGPFAVAAPTRRPFVQRVPYADAHEGIFSYSSVAQASHEGDLLAQLAERFAVSCDAAAPDAPGLSPERPDDAGFLRTQIQGDRLAAMGEDDDGSWAYLGSNCADADKATDFGTAFHRLAQYAVEHRAQASPLAMPPASRIRMMMRTCGLDGRQWSRLDDALERWFGSDEARMMEQWPALQAEVPFFVGLTVAETGEQVFLEGEIDLLAADEDRKHARVVDYKTGGHADEPQAALREKHVLQASCYAFALLRQGFRDVEASFVRVERSRADASQPQCVRYRFTAADASLLEQAITQAYMLNA